MIGWKASAPFLLCPLLVLNMLSDTHTLLKRNKLWANSVLGAHVTATFLSKGERGSGGVGGGWLGGGGESRVGRLGLWAGGGTQ